MTQNEAVDTESFRMRGPLEIGTTCSTREIHSAMRDKLRVSDIRISDEVSGLIEQDLTVGQLMPSWVSHQPANSEFRRSRKR
jgi:hypothetical protein